MAPNLTQARSYLNGEQKGIKMTTFERFMANDPIVMDLLTLETQPELPDWMIQNADHEANDPNFDDFKQLNFD